MSMFGQMAISGYCSKILKFLEEHKFEDEKIVLEKLKKMLEQDKKDCDSGWY